MLKGHILLVCWYVILVAFLKCGVWINGVEGCSFPVFDERVSGDLARPRRIPENSTCIWRISSKASSSLASVSEALLVFKSLFLTPEDRLSIIDGKGHVILGPYPGNQVPFALLTNTTEFSVVVNTSRETAYKRVLWAFVNLKDRSYNHMIEARNMIESPVYYPSPRSERLTDVKYRLLRPAADEKVAITFDHFDLRGESYLKVSGIEGVNENIHYRAEKPPDMILSSKSSPSFSLFLDTSEAGQGFRVFLEITSASCSEESQLDETHLEKTISFDASSWTFHSAKPMPCRHIITCPRGYFLELSVLHAELTNNALALFAVKDGSQYSENLLLVTDSNVGDVKGELVMSTGPALWLFYTSSLASLDESRISVNVKLQRNGGLYRNSGNISYVPDQDQSTKSSRSQQPDKVIFLLEVPSSEDTMITVFPVILNEFSPVTSIDIYDGHNLLSTPLKSFASVHSKQDFLVSSSRSMVVLRNYSYPYVFNGSFRGVPKVDINKYTTHSNKKIVGGEDNNCTLLASSEKSAGLLKVNDSLLLQVVVLLSAFILGVIISTVIHCIRRRSLRARRLVARQIYVNDSIKTVQWKNDAAEQSNLFVN